jgi:hypothetical protein
MRTPILLATTLFVFALASSAQALTVGGPTCGSCDGSEITLEIVDNLDSTYSVTLTLDSTDYDESRDGIAQIGFGGIQDWTSVALDSSPSGSAIAWSAPVEANINSGSLCGNGSTTDKICTWGFTDITADDEYVWEFTVTGGTLKDESLWHIGGQYADLSDLTDDNPKTPNGKVISEDAPGGVVPEPSAALVFGLGTLIAGSHLRRRR